MLNSANDLVSRVMLNLKGCPENMAGESLRVAFSRLCRETGCWRSSFSFTVDLDKLTEEKDLRMSIPFNPKTDGIVSKIARVFIEKSDCNGGYTKPNRLPPESYALEMRSDGMKLLFLLGCNISGADKITVDMELEPSDVGLLTDIPPSVAQSCSSAAVELASALLLGQSGRPWTDRVAQAEHLQEYQNAKRRLLYRLLVGHAEGESRSKMEIIEG